MRDWLSIAWALLAFLVRSVLRCLVTSGALFLVVTLVVAFMCWLAGVDDPRHTAITFATILSGLWFLGEMAYRIWYLYDTFQKLLQQARIDKILNDD